MYLSLFVETAIFVFGSNLAGVHGSGSAVFARRYRGALPGVGKGLSGQSYALPTKKTHDSRESDYELLQKSIADFLQFARLHPYLNFMVTRVGCGRAGFKDNEVSPLFQYAPSNCYLPGIWIPHRKALIIAGSRTIPDSSVYKRLKEEYGNSYNGEIISGMANGPDKAGALWAKDNHLKLVEAPALWDRYDKAAGYIRNYWMSWYGTTLQAFYDGQSAGTKGMIDIATQGGLDVSVVLFK